MTPERRARIVEVLQKRQTDVAVVIDNLFDPHNVGAILRSCDAFGILDVHLCYTYQKMPSLYDVRNKAAASAAKWLRIKKWTSIGELAAHLKSEKKQIVTTHVSVQSQTPQTIDFVQPTALVLGSEHEGVTPEWLALADRNVVIPMQGFVESFNVSVAASLLFYELFRQRETRGMYNKPFKGESEWMEGFLKE